MQRGSEASELLRSTDQDRFRGVVGICVRVLVQSYRHGPIVILVITLDWDRFTRRESGGVTPQTLDAYIRPVGGRGISECQAGSSSTERVRQSRPWPIRQTGVSGTPVLNSGQAEVEPSLGPLLLRWSPPVVTHLLVYPQAIRVVGWCTQVNSPEVPHMDIRVVASIECAITAIEITQVAVIGSLNRRTRWNQ